MAHGPNTPIDFGNPVLNWVDKRLPIFTMLQQEYGVFPTPRNFNYLWNFGAIALFILITMIATGVVLAMHYTADTDMAFASVDRIMRDVNFGWLIRYIHMNGASMFFIAVFIHMFRGLYYGSYKQPRELLWILGVIILLLMMATAFMGYVLPWGQMSFWGATVITNLFSALPLVGESIVTWLWGGFAVDNPTLTRFFALHFLMPFVILGVVVLHVAALHVSGSNNPLGIDAKGPQDTLPFHPYYTSKDIFGLTLFLMMFAAFVFFAPNYLGHPDNYIAANPMVTPAHIVPEWYFLPFYAILRAIPDKLGGVLAMFGAVMVLFVLPWLDTHPVRSAKFRPLYRKFFWGFLFTCLILGFCGAKSADAVLHITHDIGIPFVLISQLATAYYFGFFLVILPILSRIEKTAALPVSITEAVLAKKAGRKPAIAALLLLLLCSVGGGAFAAEGYGKAPREPSGGWSFDGMTGTYDRHALQRGFQVYKEVCAACHSMKLLSYRQLQQIGFTAAEVKAIAGEYTVMDGPNDDGEMFERAAMPSDNFKSPFPNEKAARAANGGAYPVDLSLITMARKDGSNYLYSLLTGYENPPAGKLVPEGMHYNPYFPGSLIAMAQMLQDDGVTYSDGTKATAYQMAKDVTQFLTWAGDPHMEQRKRIGIQVLLFLAAFAALMYAVKKKIWKNIQK